MKICCNILSTLIKNQSMNGFSISNDEDYFYLNFLTVDNVEMDNLVEIIMSSNVKLKSNNIKLSGQIVIKFCPYCGKKLTQKKLWISWIT